MGKIYNEILLFDSLWLENTSFLYQGLAQAVKIHRHNQKQIHCLSSTLLGLFNTQKEVIQKAH